MNATAPSALPLSPTALRAALAQLQQLEQAERDAAVARQREAQDELARQRSHRIDEAKARVQAALARYDEAATAVREAMQDVLIAERDLRSLTGSSIQGDVLVPAPIMKVHAPSVASLHRDGFGSGFTTTEATHADMQAAEMRGR